MKFTKEDHAIIDSHAILLDGLSAYFGTGYEFVLHSLEIPEESIVKIINGFHSGRSIGAPLNDAALETVEEIKNSPPGQQYKCYFTHSKTGVLLKSVSLPVFGSKERLIGLICINFYTNTPISNLLELFLPHNVEATVHKETFGYDVETVITDAVSQSKESVFGNDSIPAVNKNKEILSVLYEQGIFKLKNAVPIVATALGISKNTVYLHLRSLSGK